MKTIGLYITILNNVKCPTISFTDKVWYDMSTMDASNILLKKLWIYDRDVTY